MFNEYPCVRQETLADCGACSLLSIIKYYKGDISLEKLRFLTKTTNEGTNAYFLMEAAKELGFESCGVKGGIENIDSHLFPVIAHVVVNKSYNHFIVIYEFNKRSHSLVIADPAAGKKIISYGEFLEITSNNYVILKPIKKMPLYETKNYIKDLVVNFLMNNKKHLLVVFIFALSYTLLSIISSYNVKFLIEKVITYKSSNNLIYFLVLFLILNIFKYLSDYLRGKIINMLNYNLEFKLVSNSFKHLISLPYLYYKNKTTGDVITRVNDLYEIKNILSEFLIGITIDLLLIVFSFCFLFKISKTLTFISFVIFLVYLLVSLIYLPIYEYLIREDKIKNAKLNGFMYSNLSVINSVKGNLNEERVGEEYDNYYLDYLDNKYLFNTKLLKDNFLHNLIYDLGLIFLLFIGTKLIISNKLSLVNLLTFMSVIIYFLEPLKNILTLALNAHSIKVSLKRINELFDLKKEDLKINEKYERLVFMGNIKMDKVRYTYNGLTYVLKDINLEIKKGDKVLIKGDSGSGKSTIAKLLVGYLKLEEGNIYFDKRNIKDYHLRTIRENISYVSQDEILYNDTVYKNVTLNKEVSYQDFLKACELSGVEEIFKTSELGYDTLLEEGGFNLSGGEKERVIIARSILRNSSIYIYDESFSEIDIKKEKEILNNLFKHFKEKTIIVISHRFNNEKLFNKVISLEKGKINA